MPAERVFISYSSADRPEAFGLLKVLEDSGADAWMDYFGIKPASVLESELTTNLEAASVACILLSPTSVASRRVSFEVEHALARQAGLRIVPLILRPCRIPAGLDELVAIRHGRRCAAVPVVVPDGRPSRAPGGPGRCARPPRGGHRERAG